MPAFLIAIIDWFAANPWAIALLMVLFIAVSVLMVLAILIQRPQGGGLSAAFGGSSAGSGQTALGTKTGDALTIFTISVFTTFVLMGIILNYATTPPPPREASTEVIAPFASPTTSTTPTTTTPSPATTPGATDPSPASPAPADNQPVESQPPEAQPSPSQPTPQPTAPPASQPASQPAPQPAPTDTPKPADPAQPKN